MKKHQQLRFVSEERGFTVVFAILFSSFMLAIALALAAVFIPKLRTSGESTRSATALYAAESAVEWCLYVNGIDPDTLPPGSSTPGTLDNTAIFEPTIATDCTANPLKVSGTYKGVIRAFEVSY